MSDVTVRPETIWVSGREKTLSLLTVSGLRLVIEGKLVRVARLEHEWDADIDDPEAILRGLRRSPSRVDLFTFAQRLPHTDVRFAYHTERTNVAAIAISSFEEWWSRPVIKEMRNKVRKSQKAGVDIKLVALDEQFVEGVRAIYDESPIRQGKPMLDYRKTPDAIMRKLSTFLDRSDFLGAYYNGALIGFAKLVSAGHFTRTMHIMSSLQHRDKAPTNALLAKAVELCAERGSPYLVYGQFDYGNRGSKTLTEFKRYAGFEKVELPRYFVPLTPLGRLSLRLGVHRGVIDCLPQAVVDRMLNLRGRWYRVRYPRRSPEWNV